MYLWRKILLIELLFCFLTFRKLYFLMSQEFGISSIPQETKKCLQRRRLTLNQQKQKLETCLTNNNKFCLKQFNRKVVYFEKVKVRKSKAKRTYFKITSPVKKWKFFFGPLRVFQQLCKVAIVVNFFLWT